MSIVDHALRLAGMGFHVFPTRPDASKRPLHTGWQDKATTDPVVVRALFGAGHCNIGVFTGHPERPLLVVDEDNKGEKRGAETVLAWELQGKILPPTFTQTTPTGGRHYFYRVPCAVKQSAGKLGDGIDVRSAGGYVIGSGSTIDGRAYTDNGEPIADAPQWLIDLCAPAGVRSADTKPTAPAADVPAERAESRALAYLKSDEAPKGEAGSRNETAYRVATRLRDFGVTEAACIGMLAEHWQCSPPLEHDELVKVTRSAYTYARDAVGNADPAQQFGPVPPSAPPHGPVPAYVSEVNQEYFVLNEGGRTIVGRWAYDPVLERNALERSSFEDFRRLLLPEHVGVITEGRRQTKIRKAEAWLEHPARRQYRRGVAFAPGKELPEGTLNLWQGFAIQPAAGDWSKLRAHIRDVICAGDEVADRYVMGWLARLFQHPGEQGMVALVLRGGRGVGKGTLGNFLLRIIGQHGIYINNAKHLTGTFNAHLHDAVMVFADEAFYAGDRQHTSVLKGLVTEPYITVEAKYRNAVMARNVVHLLMASNDGWVVPAGVDERRFCVLDVADTHQQNRSHFEAVHKEANAGGLAAMLFDLLAYDLSGFDVFDVPQTKALAEQKLHSLRGADLWLSTVLQSGRIASVGAWGPDGFTVAKEDAYRDYVQFARERKSEAYSIADERVFARELRKALSGALTDIRPAEGNRRRCWVFSALDECRNAFAEHLRVDALDWEPVEFDRGDIGSAPDVFR